MEERTLYGPMYGLLYRSLTNDTQHRKASRLDQLGAARQVVGAGSDGRTGGRRLSYGTYLGTT